ncbi:MAG: YqhA family protein, partial [Rhodospirillales bacterium]|nr:YqhA family protein [Acetobacter sp.]
MDGTAATSETVAPLGAIPAPGVVERGLEHSIFATRWLLVPFYLGLVAGLLVLMTAFAKKIWALAEMTLTASMNDLTVAILGLVDLCLMANLIVMILFAGYESFVSR